MIKTLVTTAALVVASGAANAATLTFDEAYYSSGSVVTSFSKAGITGSVSAFNNPDGSVNQAMIFDTAVLSGGDADLVAPFYRTFVDGDGTRPVDGKYPGQVLIISEDGDASDPDDNGRGGTITFKFDQTVDFFGFRVFDDVTDFVVTSDKGDMSDPVSLDFDNQFTRVDLAFIGIRELTFDFGSASGAIDNLRFELTPSPVPLPASLPLLLAGLGAFGTLRRRG